LFNPALLSEEAGDPGKVFYFSLESFPMNLSVAHRFKCDRGVTISAPAACRSLCN
jgi:hypothetical protein